MSSERRISLKVAEAYRTDVGKGIARLDPRAMDQLGLETGDVIEIQGAARALAKVLPDHPGLSKPDLIRLDPQIRDSVGAKLDDKVWISKVKVSEATSIKIAPAFRYHPSIWMGFASQFLAQPSLKLEGVPLIKGQKLRLEMFGEMLDFVVTQTEPPGPVIITRHTTIQIQEAPVAEVERKVPPVRYEDIGGLKRELSLVREMIELPLRHPELFERVGIEPPKGVLLYGPPGTGKTLIAKAVANEAGAHFISVSGPEFMSKWYGESERRLREIFREAEENAPSIIFFDEIDSIAPKRSETMGEVERRVVAQLLSLMDGMKARGKVIVIGATNRIDAIDPALRRPGRFDREIELGIPDRNGRLEILQIHTRGMPLATDVDLSELADITHGFVGADLAALCREAAMRAIRRIIPEVERFKQELPPELIQKLQITKGDFMEALKGIQPSALREVFIEVPKVHWEDIGGLEKVKQELIEAVVWPIKYPEVYKQLGTKPPKGILLFGPPGTGKTLLAKAVATESEANFISIRGPELMSKWVGESILGDEQVFVLDNGIPKRLAIRELENRSLESLKVISFDLSGKVCYSKIQELIKQPIKRRSILEIKTGSGRKIRVTQDHSVFGFDGKDIVSIPAGKLKPGDYVVVPRVIPSISRALSLDLIQAFKDDPEIYVKGAHEYLVQAIAKLGYRSASQILGFPEKYLYDLVSKRISLKLPKFLKLIHAAGIDYDKSRLGISLRGSKHQLPAMLKLDPDFCELLGLWVAGGRCSNHSVMLYNSEPEISTRIAQICSALGLNAKYNHKQRAFIINSKLFKLLWERVIGLRAGAQAKFIPELILALDSPSKSRFLRGYFSGEGFIHGNPRRYVIGCSTSSLNLAEDLIQLLLEFGIFAKLRSKLERTGAVSYIVEFTGLENFERFSQIGFIDSARNRKVQEYLVAKKFARSDQIPLMGKLRDLVIGFRPEWSHSKTIGRRILREILIKHDPSKSKYPDIWNLVESDLRFDRITQIRELDSDQESVYDLCVNPAQSFLAGVGGIFAHNSERAIREVFRKARMAAPCVIFLDEIDAIAPVRGYSADAHVTERVVSQLLVELDGLVELKDVVVIAATNRPDIIDPALLRPGRFDRLIYIGPPNPQEREQIFRVHLREKPLASDVHLEELVKLTENWVGADIANLCREAGLAALREFLSSKLDPKHIKEAAKNILISWKHFQEAFKRIKPSLSQQELQAFQRKAEQLMGYI